MANAKFGSESDSDAATLENRLDNFYKSIAEDAYFPGQNYKPLFWEPIKHEIKQILLHKNYCSVLEFGAGCTGFGDYLGDIRSRVVFDVQDVTDRNKRHLETQADNIYISNITDINTKYDIVFSTFVWEHLSNPKTVLAHLIRILNLGGSLFIAAPCYDFPLYISPSAHHYSILQRLKIGLWLQWRRLHVQLSQQPDFWIHFDPAVFHRPWERDYDAIHWVSLHDLRYSLPKNMSLTKLRVSGQGISGKIWHKFMLLFVKVKKERAV